MSVFINLLSDFELNTQHRRDLVGRIAHSAVRTFVKRAILPVHDPVVRKVVHGVELFLPLSHDLPRYVGQFPYYDTVLPNLTKFLLRSDPQRQHLVFVDVGANVGDTVKLVSAAVGPEKVSFVCIEPDQIYFPLLRRNTQGLNVALHNVIAASRTDELDAAFVRDGSGTSSIVSGGARHVTVALDDLLMGQVLDLIKIDTDGYEAEVLSGMSHTLETGDPWLFLEFSPRHLIRFGKVEPNLVLQDLRAHGYSYGLVYDYRGYPMGVTQFTDQAIQFLVNYCRSAPGFYADVLLAKQQEKLLRFYEWDLPRYFESRGSG